MDDPYKITIPDEPCKPCPCCDGTGRDELSLADMLGQACGIFCLCAAAFFLGYTVGCYLDTRGGTQRTATESIREVFKEIFGEW